MAQVDEQVKAADINSIETKIQDTINQLIQDAVKNAVGKAYVNGPNNEKYSVVYNG